MSEKLADRCHGQWPRIIMTLGLLDPKALAHKDTPCPCCGGCDRFRFSDKGYGRWHCRGCDEGGDGVKLVMRILGVDFRGAAQAIEGVIGKSSWTPRRGWTPAASVNVNVAAHRDAHSAVGAHGGKPASSGPPRDVLKSWREASPATPGSGLDAYLKGRGIELTADEAQALRLHPALWHWPTQTKWPTMVALVALADGTPVTCHQTFLEPDGSGKAPIDKARLFPAGAAPRGGVWFGVADAAHELIVAEGIESALSAMRIYGAQSGVAGLSDNGIRFLDLPPQPLARLVRIFADNDAEGQGLAAAHDAARRWRAQGRIVAVSCATHVGEDANDVWMRRLKASAMDAHHAATNVVGAAS
jgi:putative DNA primase/helicase